MKIVFLEVDTERSWALASVGPGFLGAVLRRAGHEVALVRAPLDASDDEVVAAVAAQAPGLLGLSLTTRQWLRGRRLVAALRRAPATARVPVIAGGLHPTFSPEEVLASDGFDWVCLGEGEGALLDLVTALEAGQPTDRIANIWKRGGAVRPPTRPPVEPLEQLPFLARDLLDEARGVVHMATQRGCPFPCTYCAARMYNELYEQVGGEYGRRRPVEDVVAELQGLRAKGELSYVIFLDDTFTIHHPWVRRFCELYPAQVGVPFSLHARVETVSEPLLHQLRAAGCDQVTYGVESGSERVRREIMKRPVTNQRFRDVFRWTREAGIRLTANFMLGLPGETKAELQQTLQLAEELEVADFGYFVFYPYPGTALFRLCRDQGYLPADYLERPANHRASILQLPGLSNEDIASVYDGFTALRRRLFRARYGVELPEDSPATEHVELLAATG